MLPAQLGVVGSVALVDCIGRAFIGDVIMNLFDKRNLPRLMADVIVVALETSLDDLRPASNRPCKPWESQSQQDHALLAAWSSLERDSVAERFDAMEIADQVEWDLAKLKADLALSRMSTTT
jgi:hypothetical protein